ncbi:Nuclear nucleic acid-binding protein C1D, partial [Linum perenne]
DPNATPIVPDSALDSVNTTFTNLEQVEANLLQFQSLADPDVISEMPPLERAQSLLMVAKATTILFALRLRCNGLHPDEHPVKAELDRINLYEKKLDRLMDLSKAPLRRSTTLNYQAATRFIEHSLPDLTPEQRRNMKDIIRGEGYRMSYTETSIAKKRKFPASSKSLVQAAAKEFLEKAAREIVGVQTGGFKGPIQVDSDTTDEDEAPPA